MRIKIVKGVDYADLEEQTNHFLDTLNGDVTVDPRPELLLTIIHYESEEAKTMCVDCQFYDPSRDIRGAWGLCQRHGERVKFTNKCREFLDIRG